MSKAKTKFYAVIKGRQPGVYKTWPEAQAQVLGFEGAVYKGFESEIEAKQALKTGNWVKTASVALGGKSGAAITSNSKANMPGYGIAVDAACSGNPGLLEYKGVDIATGQLLFHQGPFEQGTNNLGEFLGIVHALAMQTNQGTRHTIYTDSETALSWLRKKKVLSKLERTAKNQNLWALVDRALTWIQINPIVVPVVKWDTKAWGEIPADFGRK